jgi:hypothetical protein
MLKKIFNDINTPVLFFPQLLKDLFTSPNLEVLTFFKNYGLVNIYYKDLINDSNGSFDNNCYMLFNTKKAMYSNKYNKIPILSKGKIVSVYEFLESSDKIIDLYEIDSEHTMFIYDLSKYDFINYIIEGNYSKISDDYKKQYFKSKSFNHTYTKIGNAIINKEQWFIDKLSDYLNVDDKILKEFELFSKFKQNDEFSGNISTF